MDSRREKATRLRKEGDFENALPLYADLWKGSRDKWDGWGYAHCLRKVGRVTEALDICRDVYRLDRQFAQNNGLYAWCAYDTELKPLVEDDQQASEGNILKAAQAVLKLCVQDTYSPYTLTILKVVKFLAARPTSRAKEILDWLGRLDPVALDSTPFVIPTAGGRTREAPSQLETYHLKRANAFFDLKRFDECLAASDAALATISQFHGNTDHWLKRLRAKALAGLGRLDDAKQQFDELLAPGRGQPEWFLLEEAAELEHRRGNVARAWLLLLDAAQQPGDLDKRINLLRYMADILLALGRSRDAADHARLALAVRREQGWRTDDALRETLSRTGVSEDAELTSSRDLLASVRRTWKADVATRFPEFDGAVRALLPNGRAGFVRRSDGQDFYFQMRSVLVDQQEICAGARVRFRVRDSFDTKKQRASQEAFDLRLIG